MEKQKDWEKKVTPEIIDILLQQHYISIQGENYTGEKDVALNRFLKLIESLLTQQKKEIVEEVSKLVKTTNLVGLTGESAIFANEYNKALIDVLDILQNNLLTKE